jgi:ketosteroid isomerase-like protein
MMRLPLTPARAIFLIAMLLVMTMALPAIRTPEKSAAPRGQANAVTTNELTSLLRQFLDDAGRGDRAGFERFFADDVIYTRSNGLVVNKGDILKGVERLKPTEEARTSYSAEDIVVHDYGDTAVVAFRLVALTRLKGGKSETMNYRNTGTFLRRNGVWQVVAWQSTKVPERPETPTPHH